MKKPPNTRFTITSNYDEIYSPQVFEKLLSVLMAYSYSLLEGYNVRYDKSIEELSYDFSMEAIKKHLEDPNVFNPKKNNDLVNFLKYYILKRLISNSKKLGTNKNELLYDNDSTIHRQVLNHQTNEIDIYSDIDYKLVTSQIEVKLRSKPLLLDVFKLRILEDSKRSEVCKDLNISLSEYNNRIRRLKTIISKVIESSKENHNE